MGNPSSSLLAVIFSLQILSPLMYCLCIHPHVNIANSEFSHRVAIYFGPVASHTHGYLSNVAA